MRYIMTAVALALALPVTACAKDPASANATAQTIPLTISSGDTVHRFNVEVARTEEEQKKGLMFRTSLPVDGGMLFPFPRPRIASFWMQNTLIPLDMIFVRADGSIDRIAENTIPQSLEPVASGGDVAAVLELAGGTATKLGIDEDAIIRWQDR